jgi:hypothetical protein
MRGNFAAIVLIVIGSFFLLSNLGLLNINLRELFHTWWPLILIAVGIACSSRQGASRVLRRCS